MAALIPPKLDDRSYEDLRSELIRRIPVHSDTWTDHNVSDPGVVLLELFAWLGENLLYRMNRVPQKARLEFLRLLAIAPRPARAARTLVQIDPGRGERRAITLASAPGIPRGVLAGPGGADFQLEGELQVLPVEARAFLKVPETAPELEGLDDAADLVADHLGLGKGAPPVQVRPYRARELPAVENGVLPPATAVESALDRSLWIALFAPESVVAGLEGAALEARLVELRSELSGRSLSLGVLVDGELEGPDDQLRCPNAPLPGRERPVRYPWVWQVASGRFGPGAAAPPRIDDVVYARLRVEHDATRGLERDGIVDLRLPAARREGGVALPGVGAWTARDFAAPGAVPDEDLMGVGDLPPRLEDEALEARVLTWLRGFRARAGDPAPRLRWIGANAVHAQQAVTQPAQLLGHGSGRPGQRLRLSKAPVLPGSLALQVRVADEWVVWERVDDFAGSKPDDPHYLLDAESGEVSFGDGIHGRMPLPGQSVRALSYAVGGGVRGNVGAGQLQRFAREPLTQPVGARLAPSQPFPARGGRDAESEAEASARIPKVLRSRDRAVAREDFRDLALETPGVHVGRVEVLPRHMPFERVDDVPGVVTLVVLPAEDPLHPDEPVPDRDMLRRVCEHLESRRLVTTELHVIPPEYVPVWVSVAYEVEQGYGTETVSGWVELAVRQALAPLPPYGPDGGGWPFGRRVRKEDVEAAVLRVEGVRLVHELLLEGEERPRHGSPRQVTGELGLDVWQLPVLRNVQVTDADEAEPVDRTGDRSRPGVDGPTWPVPVDVEEC